MTGNVVPVTPAGIGGEVGSERGRSLAFAVRMERHDGLGWGLSACSWRREWEERTLTREGGVVAIVCGGEGRVLRGKRKAPRSCGSWRFGCSQYLRRCLESEGNGSAVDGFVSAELIAEIAR